MKEEEDYAIPLLNNNFTCKEFEDEILSKMIKNNPDHALGHMFRMYSTIEKKK